MDLKEIGDRTFLKSLLGVDNLLLIILLLFLLFLLLGGLLGGLLLVLGLGLGLFASMSAHVSNRTTGVVTASGKRSRDLSMRSCRAAEQLQTEAVGYRPPSCS